MKKIISIFIISITFLFANDSSENLKIDIIKSIVMGIENYQSMTICSDDKKIMKAFTLSDKFKTTDNCKDSKLIILNSKSNLPKDIKDKYIFVLNYDFLYDIPNSFGAFFWKKGRPNIVFIKPRLEKYSLKLSDDLKPYIEDKLW